MQKKGNKTRNIIGLVLIIAIALVAWSVVAVQGGGKDYNLGIKEYEKGNYGVAIECYNKAIESDPNDAPAYSGRGLAYTEVGESEKALADYDKAIELEPDLAEAYFNRGLAHFSLAPLGWGNPEEVQKGIADLTKAIELKPDYADAYYNRGLGYNQFYHYYFKAPAFSEEMVGSHNLAVADFNKALGLDPDCVLACAGLGNAYYRYGEWDEATVYYNKALEREGLILEKVGEKGLKEVYHSRARNYCQFQRTHPDAISDYEKVIELDPQNIDSLVHIAMHLITRRDFEGALDYCQRGIQMIESGVVGREASWIYGYRGQCYLGLKQYDEALPGLQQMLEIMPSGEAYNFLGLCYAGRGETAKAKETFETGIAFVNGQMEQGGAWASFGIPSLHMSHWERGLCYKGLGEYEKAISDFEKARELNPPILVYGTDLYLEATKNLGIVYKEMGNVSKAKAYFEEALKRAALPEVGGTETAKEIKELLSE